MEGANAARKEHFGANFLTNMQLFVTSFTKNNPVNYEPITSILLRMVETVAGESEEDIYPTSANYSTDLLIGSNLSKKNSYHV